MKKENKIIIIVIFGILMLLFISFLLFKDNLALKKTIKFDRDSFVNSFKDFDNEHNIAKRFFGVEL